MVSVASATSSSTFIHPRKVKAARSNVHGGSKIEKLTAEHFEEVPESIKVKLREIYEYDLKLFGYQDNI